MSPAARPLSHWFQHAPQFLQCRYPPTTLERLEVHKTFPYIPLSTAKLQQIQRTLPHVSGGTSIHSCMVVEGGGLSCAYKPSTAIVKFEELSLYIYIYISLSVSVCVWYLFIIRRPAGVSDCEVLFLCLFLFCTCFCSWLVLVPLFSSRAFLLRLNQSHPPLVFVST